MAPSSTPREFVGATSNGGAVRAVSSRRTSFCGEVPPFSALREAEISQAWRLVSSTVEAVRELVAFDKTGEDKGVRALCLVAVLDRAGVKPTLQPKAGSASATNVGPGRG